MDYEKKYNEALKRAKAAIDIAADRDLVKGVATTIFPELRESESEDERIRKEIIDIVEAYRANCVYEGTHRFDDCLAYLEKQKYDRMKPIYDARESFESALEKAWNDYHNGYENVDKLEDDYVECAHAKGFREGYLFGIEKQKEQKPVEIDEDVELGLDRALQIVKKAKGNLQGYQTDDGIYECDHAIGTLKHILKRGIKQKPVAFEGVNGVPCPYGNQVVDLSPVEWNDTDMKEARENLITCCRDWEKGDPTTLLPIVAKRARHFLENTKPVEWSEEDEECRNEILQYIEQRIGDGTTGQALWKKWYNWLKYLRTQPQGVYKQIVHNILDMIDRYESLGYDVTSNKTCIPQIRAMCKTADECHEILDEPSWKPSEEQMEALEYVIRDYIEDGCNATANYLQEILDHLKNM